jgi:hypothetical protein
MMLFTLAISHEAEVAAPEKDFFSRLEEDYLRELRSLRICWCIERGIHNPLQKVDKSLPSTQIIGPPKAQKMGNHERPTVKLAEKSRKFQRLRKDMSPPLLIVPRVLPPPNETKLSTEEEYLFHYFCFGKPDVWISSKDFDRKTPCCMVLSWNGFPDDVVWPVTSQQSTPPLDTCQFVPPSCSYPRQVYCCHPDAPWSCTYVHSRGAHYIRGGSCDLFSILRYVDRGRHGGFPESAQSFERNSNHVCSLSTGKCTDKSSSALYRGGLQIPGYGSRVNRLAACYLRGHPSAKQYVAERSQDSPRIQPVDSNRFQARRVSTTDCKIQILGSVAAQTRMSLGKRWDEDCTTGIQNHSPFEKVASTQCPTVYRRTSFTEILDRA